MMQHKVVILGGGTFNHISCHLSLAAPAFGQTARKLHELFQANGLLESKLVLTKMADYNSKLITNSDVEQFITQVARDMQVKAIVMNAAICDFEADNPSDEARLSSSRNYNITLNGIQGKILAGIRKARPDVILVGFKTTHGANVTEQLNKASSSMLSNGLDIVLANDVNTRSNILLMPGLKLQSGPRDYLLEQLVNEVIDIYRTHAWC